MAAPAAGTTTAAGAGALAQRRDLHRVGQRVRRVRLRTTPHRDGDALAAWPATHTLRIPGIGDVLFCHATPRNDTEIFLKTTSDERLRPIFDTLGVKLVVCGHTHMQFDRIVGRTRIVNAGSVGMPFQAAGAYWAVIGPGVSLRRTSYDLDQAAQRVRATAYPQATQCAAGILAPPDEQATLEQFKNAELT